MTIEKMLLLASESGEILAHCDELSRMVNATLSGYEDETELDHETLLMAAGGVSKPDTRKKDTNQEKG